MYNCIYVFIFKKLLFLFSDSFIQSEKKVFFENKYMNIRGIVFVSLENILKVLLFFELKKIVFLSNR